MSTEEDIDIEAQLAEMEMEQLQNDDMQEELHQNSQVPPHSLSNKGDDDGVAIQEEEEQFPEKPGPHAEEEISPAPTKVDTAPKKLHIPKKKPLVLHTSKPKTTQDSPLSTVTAPRKPSLLKKPTTSSLAATTENTTTTTNTTLLIKRSKGAYQYFAEDARARLKGDNPDISFGDMNKIIGEEWKALSDGERAPFQEMADKDKERYQQEVAAGGVADAKKKGSKAAPAPRVKSSYQLFCDEHRPRIKKDNPKAGMGEITKLLSMEWNALSDEEKAPYIHHSKELKAQATSESVQPGHQGKKRHAKADGEGGSSEHKKKVKKSHRDDDSEVIITLNDVEKSCIDKDEDEIDRENVDWDAHPAIAILSKTRAGGKYIIARRGLPLHLYGEISVETVHQQRTHGSGDCPVTLDMLEEFEEFNKKFKRDIFERTEDGELDLDPNELPHTSTLESCAFLGGMRDPSYELNGLDRKHDVYMKVPMMATSRLVQRMIQIKCMEAERKIEMLQLQVEKLEKELSLNGKKATLTDVLAAED